MNLEPQGNVSDVPVLSPWENHPYQFISWLEMLQFSAKMFLWCGKLLHEIKTDCLIGSIPGTGNEPTFHVAADIDERARTKALKILVMINEHFRDLGMQITADTVQDVVDDLNKTSVRRNFQWLMDKAGDIDSLAHKELSGKVFLYVPAEQAKYFPRKNDFHLFGESVAEAFPSATSDITEAGQCLALSRASASVFHLMRVLEIGLGALGKKFDVSTTNTNWAPAIAQIELAVREMHKDPKWKELPDCKEQQTFYAQAASHFGILKDAWRNYAMHARGAYTEEQAVRIFESVKSFMQTLAERIKE
jgi:hypothetical protein